MVGVGVSCPWDGRGHGGRGVRRARWRGRPCRDRVAESKGRKSQGSTGAGGVGVAHDSHVLSFSPFLTGPPRDGYAQEKEHRGDANSSPARSATLPTISTKTPASA